MQPIAHPLLDIPCQQQRDKEHVPEPERRTDHGADHVAAAAAAARQPADVNRLPTDLSSVPARVLPPRHLLVLPEAAVRKYRDVRVVLAHAMCVSCSPHSLQLYFCTVGINFFCIILCMLT